MEIRRKDFKLKVASRKAVIPIALLLIVTLFLFVSVQVSYGAPMGERG